MILNDLDPVISGIWEYLIKVKEEEVLALPLLVYGESLDDIKLIPEAKNFIGQCLQTGRPSPRKKLSSAVYTRPGTVWCESMRSRIASQLCQIRHWKITSKSYLDLDNREATWFIDPPYEKAGKAYIVNQMDYAACATFCKSREGQTLVCEAEGASWLPFEPFTDNPSNASRVTKEVIWTNEN